MPESATSQGGAAGRESEMAPALDPRRWQALAVCLVAGFMTLLDVSIVNVALPSIRNDLRSPESDLQWVLSGYSLAFGLLLIPAGRLGDARGRREVFLAGLAVFTLASVACGAAPSSFWLVVARVVQGLGGALISPQISALIQQMFSGQERGRAFGMFSTVVAISTAVGPLLGGLLIQAAGREGGWRWVFFVNLPLGLVCFLLARRLLPDTPAAGRVRPRDLDPVGVLLLGAGVLALLLPFIQAQQWSGDGKWLLVAVAVVLLGVFACWEARCGGRGTVPVLDMSLFRMHSYWLGCLLSLLYFAGFTSIFFISTLYLQAGLHCTALEAGLAITPFALGAAAAAGPGGRMVGRYGRPLVAVGLSMVVVGLGGTVFAVHLVPGSGVAWAMAAPLLLAGVGSGLVIAPNLTLTLSQVPVVGGGSAAGTLQTGQRVGSAIGIAAVGSVFFARLPAAGWRSAFDSGLIVSAAFVLGALVLALTDVGISRRNARRTHGLSVPGPSDWKGDHDEPPHRQ
ncbi:MFS transporter [Streptomyces sp. NBC_01707]|nr:MULTISPECIES: MFS transporter [unclassified Streptomyces]MDX2731131.1 MFS transporter [Streptomyces sp. PA03-2a]MDX3770057.1 MFS transporter [Streptomyces sp. AK08-01B]MDX3819328.1 MFS transporter [Streptomyces sp. AK08-01A]